MSMVDSVPLIGEDSDQTELLLRHTEDFTRICVDDFLKVAVERQQVFGDEARDAQEQERDAVRILRQHLDTAFKAAWTANARKGRSTTGSLSRQPYPTYRTAETSESHLTSGHSTLEKIQQIAKALHRPKGARRVNLDEVREVSDRLWGKHAPTTKGELLSSLARNMASDILEVGGLTAIALSLEAVQRQHQEVYAKIAYCWSNPEDHMTLLDKAGEALENSQSFLNGLKCSQMTHLDNIRYVTGSKQKRLSNLLEDSEALKKLAEAMREDHTCDATAEMVQDLRDSILTW